MRLRTARVLLSLPKLKLVSGGEEVLPESHEYTTFPEPIRNEQFELHPHESPSRNMDVSKEIHFLYRDLLKSIPFMKYAHLIAIPESQIRKRLRSLFEEGPKLRDNAAIRQRIINASADADEYFKQMMMSMQVLGKYFPLEENAFLKKDIIEATKPTQAASRFFNEGTNILLDAGVGHEDITENRVYIAREDAYRRGISKLGSAELLQHFSNGLDKAGSYTLQALSTSPNRDTLLEAAIKSKSKVTDESAAGYLEKSEVFQSIAGYKIHQPLGDVVQKAWENYRDTVFNQVVITHSAYKSLISDPLRHELLRGPADLVRLTDKGNTNLGLNGLSPDLLKVSAHYYYSDQLTDTWSEDLGVSYLADLKGVDRRLDLLLDQEIGFRTEHIKRIYVYTVESIKATYPLTHIFQALINGEKVDLPSELSSLKSEKKDQIESIFADHLKKHLDSYDWSKFTVSQKTKYNVPKELDIFEW